MAPDAECFPVVILLADISGFSALTTTLAARGTAGAEDLSHILNDRFGRLVDVVYLHGGEVLDFAGDAAIAYWPLTAAADAAGRATACALAIRDAVEGPLANGIALRVRIGVGAGDALSALVGGSSDRWLTLVAGDARTEMLKADSAAEAGDVVLAPSVVRLVGDRAAGIPVAGGCVRLLGVGAVAGPPSALMSAPAADFADDPAVLRTGVPRAVQRRIDAGQRHWLAEFATMTTLFVNVPDVSYEDPGRLEALQRVVLTMQSAVHRFDGSVNRLMADDKGTVLLAVWGVPLHTHEDDAARAVLAALAIRDALRALGIRPAIGLTTGRAFAGTVGNALRKQYALLGESVNLAARLMQEARDEVLCDAPTRAAAHAYVRFGLMAPRRVKGGALVEAGTALSPRERSRPGDIINRQSAQRLLGEAIADLDERGESRVIVITGEPGIGKSALVGALLARAHTSRLRVLAGAGASIDPTAPYHPWRGVFDALLGVDESDAADTRLRKVSRLLGDDPRARFLPLAADALGIVLPPSDVTAGLTANARAEAARDVLTHIFLRAGGNQPLALVLEDAHWMDSSSWSLAAAVHREVPRLLLVLVLRPIAADDMNDECRRLLAEAEAHTIDLDVLSGDEAVALACRRLDVDALPDAVAELIRERGEGHPLFTEQLVRTLVDRQVIRVENHECRADPGLPIPAFPETVHGLIRGRIDLLAADEQLTIKIASILGRQIDLDALDAIHPLQRRAAIDRQLSHMATLDLLESNATLTGARYAFKHAIVQEVAYAMLAVAQRRELHKSAAEWYERPGVEGTPAYALLARHWSEAGAFDKALAYLERAADQAFDAGNYRETLTLMTEALAIAERSPEHRTPLRHAVWLRRAGQACYGLGRVNDSRRYMERAAAALGQPLPTDRRRTIAGIVGASTRLWLRRLWRGGGIDPVSPRGLEIVEAATIVDGAAYPYYLVGETLGLIYCLVRRLDLTDRLTPTGELAAATTGVAYVWGLAGFYNKADQLNAWALATAEALQIPRVRAFVLYSSAVLDVGRGNWAQGAARASESAAIYVGLGEQLLARDSYALPPYMATFYGDWPAARAGFERLRVEATRHDNRKQLGWAHVGLAKVHYREGDFASALNVLDEGLSPALEDPGSAVAELALITLRACVRARTDDVAGAAADIAAALSRIDPQVRPAAFMQADAYGFLADACFQTARKGADDAARRGAEIACAALQRAARVFPAARPAALLWNGVQQASRGATRRAERMLRQALAGATQIPLVFERERAAEEISRLTGTPPPR